MFNPIFFSLKRFCYHTLKYSIAQNCFGVDAVVDIGFADVTWPSAYPMILGSFLFLEPEDMHRILSEVTATTSVLDIFPF